MSARSLALRLVLIASLAVLGCGDSGGGGGSGGDDNGSDDTAATGDTGDDTGTTAPSPGTGDDDDDPGGDGTGTDETGAADEADATSGDAGADETGEDDDDGFCPNYGTDGVGTWFEVCDSDAYCECGYFCKSGACMPFEGDDEGCSCGETDDTGDEPDATGGGTEDVDEGPDVDLDDCFEPAPNKAKCNPYCQLGCNDGQHCVLQSTNFACADVGSLPHGSQCAEAGDCEEGLSCYGLADEPSPTCRKWCFEDSECPNAWECKLELSFSAGFTVTFCSPIPKPCDLWSQDCKGAGQCILVGSATTCANSTGEAAKGETCGASTDCTKGLLCVGTICVQPCSAAAAPPAGAPACADVCEAPEALDPVLEINYCK